VTSATLSRSPLIVRAVEILSAALLVVAFLSIQALIGGTRLLFAFPAYGLIAVVALLSIVSFRSAKAKLDQICLWSAILFFGYVLVRATFSPLPYLARSDIYSVLAGLVVYLLTCCVLTSAKARMSILACLLAAALAHVLVGAIQFRSGNNFMPISFLQRFDYGRRASGFYVCPNHLAGLLEVLGIFGLSIVCWSRWPVWSKLLIGYATAVSYLGVILTGSRGGYLSTAASLLVFAVITLAILREGGSALLLRIGAAGALVAAIGITSAVFLVRQSDFLSDRANNVLDYKNMRLDLWRAATEQWKQSPLIGTGSRTYLVYGRKYRTERMQLDPIYTHNDYLQLLGEYGMVGAGTFLGFFLVHLRRGWTDARRLGLKRIAVSHRLASNAMALNAGALCAVAAYAVHSVFDFNLHIPANVLLLAFVFGIIANPGVTHENSPSHPAPGLIFWRVVAFVLAAVLGWQVWRLAPGEYFAEKARVALRDYRFLSAVDFARKGLEYESANPLLFYYLGRGRVMGGDSQQSAEASASYYEAALPAFAEARELAPLDKTYTLELAFTYDALGRFSEAEWFYYEARALDPRSTSTNRYYQAHLERWKTGGLKSAQEPRIQ
jgi:O-antigen ligase